MLANRLIAITIIGLVGVPTGLVAQENEQRVDLSVRHKKTQTLRGPVTLHLLNVNRLRYFIDVGVETTVSDGPDASLVKLIPALPSVPSVGQAPQPVAAAALGTTAQLRTLVGTTRLRALVQVCSDPTNPTHLQCLTDEVNGIQNELRGAAAAVGTAISSARNVKRSLEAELAKVEGLVRQSDQTLSMTGGASALAQLVSERVTSTTSVLAGPWPTVPSAARKTVTDAIAELNGMPIEQPVFSVWIQTTSNYQLYLKVKAMAEQLEAAIKGIDKGSAAENAAAEARKTLNTWLSLMTPRQTALGFEQKVPVSCGYPFFSKTEHRYEITRTDRTISDPKKASVTTPLVTVTCPSSLSISGGIAYANLPERDYTFVSGVDEKGMLQTRIGEENSSSSQINLVLLLNTRIGNSAKSNSWHLSAGTVFDFDDPKSSVTLGFIAGISWSLKDNFFVTAGAEALRVEELGPGFKLGDPVPEGLSSVPTVSEWDYAFSLGVSYRIK